MFKKYKSLSEIKSTNSYTNGIQKYYHEPKTKLIKEDKPVYIPNTDTPHDV